MLGALVASAIVVAVAAVATAYVQPGPPILPASRLRAPALEGPLGGPVWALRIESLDGSTARCSGAQLAGTHLMATAAHCLSAAAVRVTARSGTRLVTATRWWVHHRFHDDGDRRLADDQVAVDVGAVEFPSLDPDAVGALRRPVVPRPGDAAVVHAYQYVGAGRAARFAPVICAAGRPATEMEAGQPEIGCELLGGASGAPLVVGRGTPGRDLVGARGRHLGGVLSTYLGRVNHFAPGQAVIELIDRLPEGERWAA